MRRGSAVVLLCSIAFITGCAGGDARPAPAGSRIVKGSTSRLASTLESLRGKPIVVNYWATWCEPCKKEMPLLVAAAREYDGRVEFLGVNVEDDAKAAARFLARYEVPFRNLSDERGEIRRDEGIRGLPVTQFYGSDGDLAFLHNGEIDKAELEEKISEVLRSAPDES